MHDYDYLFKIILIGNSGVGKTSIINRYVDEIYTENFISTIGVDFKIKTVRFNNLTVKLQIWDTAGQERFKAITTSYYRGSHCIFIVFDVTDTQSFNDIPSWIEEIKKQVNDALIVILANKIDIKDRPTVQEDEILKTIEEQKLDKKLFKFISAKENTNIESIFTMIVEKLIERVSLEENEEQAEYPEIEYPTGRKGCC